MKASMLLAAVLCCAMTGAAWAQDHKHDYGKGHDAHAGQPAGEKPGGMPEMGEAEQAWMEAGTPGEMHKWIAKGVGTWDATVKMMMPGEPEQESKATVTTRMMFDGRYAHSRFQGSFMGQPFEGLSTLGYNKAAGRFESVWIDSMSTMTMFATGHLDAAGKVLTLTGEMMDPATKKPIKQKMVTTWKSDDRFVDEMYHEMDGKEVKVMEIVYTRAKGHADENEKHPGGGADKHAPGKH